MKRWTLAGRLTAWFVGLTMAVIAVTSAAGAWFLKSSIDRELDALAVEELHELRAIFRDDAPTPPELEEVVRELAREHPAVSLAWRLFHRTTGAILAEFGVTDLLGHAEHAPSILGRTLRPEQGLRWRAEEITRDSDLCVGLMIDGSARFAALRRFGQLVLAILGLGVVASLAAGGLFCRRASGMLRQVAESARAIQRLDGDVEVRVNDAPEEIRVVAEAFTETLRNVRSETARARLLISGLAHELRSPIQNLLGESDVLLLRERAPGEYRSALESHAEELRDLGRVVDNLVTLCASPDGLDDAREDFDLAREIDLRLPRENARAQRQGVILDVESTGDLRMTGDREAVLLVLRNLIANAIDWSPGGEVVTVRLEGGSSGVEVTVDDAGPGVPEPERARIFDPFYRGPSCNGRRAGYGLGLALSRSAVEAHGGRIEVSTNPAGGARFVAFFPRRVRAAARG